ncbi:MAG: NADH-quinone oxidoreductase subunit M [Bacteroidetes bacterium]|nr:NADH-quinone oxidoreductase subunit M [Bacteroidota bacterium]
MLSVLIFFPFVAALATLIAKENAKRVALGATVIEFALSVWMAMQFNPQGGTQFMVDYWWVPSLGISFKVGMDGISMLLVLLTTFLVPIIILSSFSILKSKISNLPLFYSLILFMQMALVGVFVALDGFLFYIFWELALIPIYLICLMWGGKDRIRITIKFFIYTLVGSLFMLVGLIYLYLQTPGTHTFDIQAFYNLHLSASEQGILFWAFFLAFAIKMPVFPFHTWQPDTYTDAPTPGTMLLSGIMLKMGIYGVIRWLLPVVPMGVNEWGTTAIVLSVIGVVYASCIALVQKDFKRLIAYSSIAHVGLISAGIFSLNLQGMQGGMIQMLSHGINVVGMFFIADIIMSRTNTRNLNELGGIRNVAPTFATYFVIILLASVALPLTNGFIGEFLLINGLYQYNAWMAAVAGLTIILGAVYMLVAYKKITLGEKNKLTETFTDLTSHEKIVMIPLVIMIFAIGIYPKPFLDIAEPSVQNLLNIIHGTILK